MNQANYQLQKAYEEGYQKGLYDGLIAAHQNSNGRIPHPDSAVAPKRIIAVSTPWRLEVDEDWLAEQEQDSNQASFLQGIGRY